MKELKIPRWTGVCNINCGKILGLGNDIYQIAVALIEGERKGAAKITFNEADANRKIDNNVDGIIDLFPNLKDGILINGGDITDTQIIDSCITRHWHMAYYNSLELRNCLIKYFKPYISNYLTSHSTRLSLIPVLISIR